MISDVAVPVDIGPKCFIIMGANAAGPRAFLYFELLIVVVMSSILKMLSSVCLLVFVIWTETAY